MDFPYGKARLVILIASLVSGTLLLYVKLTAAAEKPPDLVMATFTHDQFAAYLPAAGPVIYGDFPIFRAT